MRSIIDEIKSYLTIQKPFRSERLLVEAATLPTPLEGRSESTFGLGNSGSIEKTKCSGRSESGCCGKNFQFQCVF
jgi:hypothetical protein